MPESQLEQFSSDVHDALKDMPPINGNAPKVPFQTALQLTLDQETKMIDFAFKRYDDMQNESVGTRRSTLPGGRTWRRRPT